jgi:hypothetical protein
MYWNFVAIDGVIKNQLDKYATECNTQKVVKNCWYKKEIKGSNVLKLCCDWRRHKESVR